MMNELIQLARPYLTQITFGLIYLAIVGVLGRKTQIEAWVAAHPRTAFWVRIARAVCPDPWLLLKAFREKAAAAARIPPGLLVLAVTLSLAPSMSGCAGTLEESRGQAQIQSLAGIPTVRNESACRALSAEAKWYGATAKVSAALAGGSGIAAWPIEDKNARVALVISAGALGAASLGLVYLYDATTNQWVTEGCAVR
jgi:hypothetical protein